MKTKTGTTNVRTRPSRQKSVSLLFTLLMVVLLAGVAVAGCKGNGNSGKGSSGKVAVPNLMTLTYEEAKESLKSAGLVCNVSGDLSGTVVAQSVAAGTPADAGSTVTITLQGATTQVLVPAITGMTLTDAINALAGVKLFMFVESGDLTGTVASVSPAKGTAVDICSVVRVTMAATPTSVTAPDLSGMKLPDALKTLQGFGLYAVPTGTDFNGSVTAQDPAAGTTVNVGSEVTISVDMLLRPATTTSNTGPA